MCFREMLPNNWSAYSANEDCALKTKNKKMIKIIPVKKNGVKVIQCQKMNRLFFIVESV